MDDTNINIRGGNRKKMYTITSKGKAILEEEVRIRERLNGWDFRYG